MTAEVAAPSHKPLPKSWKTASGYKVEMLGGLCGRIGQWLRMPEGKFDQEIPMPNGEVYRLVKNYPGYKYEWVYVLKDHLESGEIIGKQPRKRK